MASNGQANQNNEIEELRQERDALKAENEQLASEISSLKFRVSSENKFVRWITRYFIIGSALEDSTKEFIEAYKKGEIAPSIAEDIIPEQHTNELVKPLSTLARLIITTILDIFPSRETANVIGAVIKRYVIYLGFTVVVPAIFIFITGIATVITLIFFAAAKQFST